MSFGLKFIDCFAIILSQYSYIGVTLIIDIYVIYLHVSM